MALADQITALGQSSQQKLTKLRAYYEHTQAVWRLAQQIAGEGRKVSIRNTETNRILQPDELHGLAQTYVTGYLAESVFDQTISLFEDFFLGSVDESPTRGTGVGSGPIRPEEVAQRFVWFPAFLRDWERLGLDGEDLRSLELEILKDPSQAPVIKGTGGLRKVRFSGRKSTRGTSGANRVCYLHFPEFGTIALAVVFGKNEKDDLSPVDRNAIAAMIRAYREELASEANRAKMSQRDQANGGTDG